MEDKICPLLKAAGFVNGKEICSDECALYTEYGSCALVVLAERAAAQDQQFPVDLGKTKGGM